MVDRDSFSLPQTGARDRAEFYMPLVFYLFGFLVSSWTCARRRVCSRWD